jgi:acetolactate synthase I/II/III large subunit
MAKNMLDGAQVIVDYLIRQKVPYAFGLCGHGNIQFIDALYERSSDIKTISVHHERVAGFMADVYYRVTGQPTATGLIGPRSTSAFKTASAALGSEPAPLARTAEHEDKLQLVRAGHCLLSHIGRFQ